jgi:hypothetical protein
MPFDDNDVGRLQGMEVALRSSQNTIRGIVRRVENQPQNLGISAFIARNLQGMSRSLQGLINLSPTMRDVAEKTGAKAAIEGVLNDAIKLASVESGKIRSSITVLTFQAGKMLGQSGLAFSNRDAEAIAKAIAEGISNDKLMVGVLRSFAALQSSAFNVDFKTFTGGRKFVGVPDQLVRDPFGDLDVDELEGIIPELLNSRQHDLYLQTLQQKRGALTIDEVNVGGL